jgi:hypothetical protein
VGDNVKMDLVEMYWSGIYWIYFLRIETVEGYFEHNTEPHMS